MAETLEELQKAAIAFRDARDWRQFHRPKDLVLGLQIEGAELAELFLWKTPEECQELLAQEAFADRVGEELADVQIFLLYLAEETGIDLGSAVRKKLAQNEKKYPVKKSRGNATKWSDLT